MPIFADFRPVNRLLRQIGDVFPIEPKAGRRAMLILEERIKDRTLEGRDVDNEQFTPYSPVYELFKRELRGGLEGPVDLFLRGTMFAAMTHTVTKDSMRLFFGDVGSGQKATKHMLGDGVPEREFFAPNANDLGVILEELIRPFDRLV